MSDFDLNQIRRLDGGLLLVFRELLRRRQASAVAQHLGLTPSAVSHALARLRDIFGDPLFVRRPHGFTPTPRALALGPRIDALIDLAGETLAPESGFDPARSGRRFNLACAEFVLTMIGGRLLEIFRGEAPRCSFAIEFMPLEEALRALERGQLDLCIGQYGLTQRAVFETALLYEDHYCVAARRGHPALSEGAIDLERYCTIGHVFAQALGEGAATDTLPSPAYVATNALTPRWLNALLMVSASDAIASCPKRLVDFLAPTLGLQAIPLYDEAEPFPVTTVRRAGGADPAVDWLLAQVRRAVPPAAT